MTVVEATRVLIRLRATVIASSEATSYFSISYGSAPNARTTRIPVRFSSMICPSAAMRSCRVSHIVRNFRRATEDCQATKGTKLRLNRPSNRSVDNNRYAPIPIKTVNNISRSSPVLMNMRTPSTSSMPRVINSPVWT